MKLKFRLTHNHGAGQARAQIEPKCPTQLPPSEITWNGINDNFCVSWNFVIFRLDKFHWGTGELIDDDGNDGSGTIKWSDASTWEWEIYLLHRSTCGIGSFEFLFCILGSSLLDNTLQGRWREAPLLIKTFPIISWRHNWIIIRLNIPNTSKTLWIMIWRHKLNYQHRPF